MRKGQAGFSLIEMMLAMLVSGITIAAALGIGFAVRNSFQGQRRAMVAERTARATTEMVARAIRAAIPGVSTGDIRDLVGCSTFRGIAVTDGGNSSPDSLSIIWGAGQVTSLRAEYMTSSSQLRVLDGSLFRLGDYVLITNLGAEGALVKITAAPTFDSGTGDWLLPTGTPTSVCSGVTWPTGTYPAGALAIRARMAKFAILQDVTTGNAPVFTFDKDVDGTSPAEQVAPGIEDFQVAIGIDSNGDGALQENGAAANDDEWIYNHANDNVAPLITVTQWKAIRITITATTATDGTQTDASFRPAAENRAAGTADSLRRRTLSTTVQIRNTQGSL